MAYQGSKGWYVKELKKMGVLRHPIGKKKLEQYKTYELRNLYLTYLKKQTS
jgi:hypothetical protein